MQKKMKLSGFVIFDENDVMVFHGKSYDGTQFSMYIEESDVELNDRKSDEKQVGAWLIVTQEGQQHAQCHVTLPKPNLRFGNQVIVNELDLLPMNASIASFNPKLVPKSAPKVPKM